ncbi:MAG: lipocalin family protein [Burkholderiales bacterium]|nr:lipocalin family protein [Burkholderiales bacterium]
MKKYVLAFFILAGLSSYALDNKQEVKAIDNFNAQKYLGDWYEIARIPFYFESQCKAPTKANYQLDGDDIAVTNSCMTDSGEIDVAHGIAYFMKSTTIAKLKVTFVPSWLRFTHIGRGDYWVLYTDYQYSLVGSPNHSYLWILSRSESAESTQISKLLNIATNQGFDVTKLHFNYPQESNSLTYESK